MTITLLGGRAADATRVRQALPGLDLRHFEADNVHRAALAGTVVVYGRYVPHKANTVCRSAGVEPIVHRGGTAALIERLRALLEVPADG